MKLQLLNEETFKVFAICDDRGNCHVIDFLGSVGAVLAGSTFGDHCSPISDTTILSSMASERWDSEAIEFAK